MKRTTIMAEEETLYRIGRIAQREGKSKAAIIRAALVEYIIEAEKAEPFENPLLALVGIAECEDQETEWELEDLSDGKDEKLLADIYDADYERSLAEFEADWAARQQ